MSGTPKRIVVKVGTSSLVTPAGHFSKIHLGKLCRQLLSAIKSGHEIVLVSSGAIACGMDTLGLNIRPKDLARLQACAAVGQGKLMKAYEDFFSKQAYHTAQVLLTRDGIEDRKRYFYARNTLNQLLEMKVLPVVNENDTVATEEIRFGDNDMLSALVASLVGADLLIILSDVDGFYLKDKTVLPRVDSLQMLDQELKEHLYQRHREKTTGGMEAKLAAARYCMHAGIPMVLANGLDGKVVERILSGQELGTRFDVKKEKRAQRKNWLAFSKVRGEIQVDTGARKALLESGRSLLASGIVKVSGAFEVGDAVKIIDAKKNEIARGLTNYSKKEIEKIGKHKSGEISVILGYKNYDEVVHRNNLVLT